MYNDSSHMERLLRSMFVPNISVLLWQQTATLSFRSKKRKQDKSLEFSPRSSVQDIILFRLHHEGGHRWLATKPLVVVAHANYDGHVLTGLYEPLS
mmetsp:Transcript_78330/g.151276  ORF Transcript_78330/g.151276 Transcript_78330/m.151276 type:complete len:96 (-) Transcript_78330:1072-1359(-)